MGVSENGAVFLFHSFALKSSFIVNNCALVSNLAHNSKDSQLHKSLSLEKQPIISGFFFHIFFFSSQDVFSVSSSLREVLEWQPCWTLLASHQFSSKFDFFALDTGRQPTIKGRVANAVAQSPKRLCCYGDVLLPHKFTMRGLPFLGRVHCGVPSSHAQVSFLWLLSSITQQNNVFGAEQFQQRWKEVKVSARLGKWNTSRRCQLPTHVWWRKRQVTQGVVRAEKNLLRQIIVPYSLSPPQKKESWEKSHELKSFTLERQHSLSS